MWSAPGSASITASNTSPGEHDITHTYARSHRGDPHWAKFPLAPPACQQFLYTYCVCVPTVCPLASRLNQCPLQNVCWGPLPMPTSQPIKTLNLPTPPPSLVDRPITGRSSQEGPVTWVIVVALATGIILAWKQEEVKWTFHSLTNSQKLRKRQHVSKNRLPEKEFEVRDSL